MSEAEKKVQNEESDELYLVDGSGFIFRAYFALPQNLTNPKGEPVGAVLGFTNMLVKLLTDFKAHQIAIIFDAARKNFRYDIYSEYKANRSDPPEDLIPQFPMFRQAAEAFGLPAIEIEGYEADDLIATYAKRAVAQGKKVTIVGSDKDLYQTINDHVRLYDPIKQKYIGREQVIEKFGVPPEKVIDVQALSGDSVDNIPGVPGIGPKTAAQLISEYGTLENLLERAVEIKQNKRRENLIEFAENARISKQLVTLATDVDVPLLIKDMSIHDIASAKLKDFLEEQGFKTVITRLNFAQANTNEENEPTENFGNLPTFPPAAENTYTLITDAKDLMPWINEAYETGVLVIDTETTSLTPAKAELVGISLTSTIGKAAYIPVGHTQAVQDLFDEQEQELQQADKKEVLEKLKPLLEDESVIKIAHNMKYDWQMFAQEGIFLTPCDDTMLISYVLDGSSHSHGMDNLSQMYCGHKPIKYEEVAGKGKNQVTFDRVPIEKALNYAAEDAEITLRLYKILKPRLAQEKMTAVYENIERPLIQVIAQMEMNGIRIDPYQLQEMSTDFGKKLIILEQEIHKLAGQEFNIASPKQVGEILFNSMGLQGGKKTKTGDWSTNASILEKLADEGHKIVQKILEHRQLSKLKSTYTDSLQEQINPKTGRIHTSFAMAHTNTGRLSSSDPNLQNIPIRTEEGRKIREAFVAEDGHVLVSVDYSQVELRLAAAFAGISALIQAFKDGVDIHTLTASQVFDVPLEQITPDIRRQAKAVNFGIIYGISGWGLAKQLGIEAGEANEFIRRYLNRFIELQDFMEAAKAEARANGFIKTRFGRKCVIDGIKDKNPARRKFAERQAINAPLQGAAADIMKVAMGLMPKTLSDKNLKARMLLQVHDELVFEVPENELEKTIECIQSVMENVVDIGVPLTTEGGSGKNWAEAH